MSPEMLARYFHMKYEELAPQHGYETRADTERAAREKAEQRCARMEKALREILVGKIQYDNEHPLGAGESMAGRFLAIARAAVDAAGDLGHA